MAMIILIIVIVLLIAIVGVYNGLIQSRNKVKNAWSQIDVQLQRRFDLIPNLIEAVKGYMQHEESVLTKVTELRNAWASATTVTQKAELDNELTGALKTIMAVSENYPDLKADQSFTELQEELRNTENKISYARQFYNDSATMYNTKIQMVPTNIVAAIFNFSEESLFKVESEEARRNVKVDFSK